MTVRGRVWCLRGRSFRPTRISRCISARSKVGLPFGLLKYGLKKGEEVRHVLTGEGDLKSSYDVVVIGAGGHGLAIAYYLAREHGIRDGAVLERVTLAAATPPGTRRSSAPTT